MRTTTRFALAAVTAAGLCPWTWGQNLAFGSDVLVPGREGRTFLQADLDGDGVLDAVITRRNGEGRHVLESLRGDGRGGYTPVWVNCHSCGSVSSPDLPALVDLDGDGDLDLVTLTISQVSTFLNDGSGHFVLQWSAHSFTAGHARWIACGDLDGDGAGDVVFGTVGEIVYMMRGAGTGALGTEQLVPVNASEGVAVDFDGDGRDELALAGHNPSRLALVELDAAGAATARLERALATHPRGLSAVDLDHDGQLDFCLHLLGQERVSVVLGAGGQLSTPREFEVGGAVQALATGDFDGDGNPDLACAIDGAGLVRTLLGSGDGGFTTGSTTRLDAPALCLSPADIDRDGDFDLIVGLPQGGAHLRLHNRGDGTFVATSAESYDTTETGSVISVSAVDLDGDGLPELVYPGPLQQAVQVRRNEGQRAFGPAFGFPAGQVTDKIWTEDLDGDSHPDILARGAASVSVLFGDGTGRLSAPMLLSVGTHIEDVMVGDCDGDGRRDIVVTRSGGLTGNVVHDLVVWTQTAPRSFAPLAANLPLIYAAPFDASLGDVTGDGRLDVTLRERDFSGVNHRVRVLAGQGDGTFVPEPPSPHGNDLRRLAVHDLNGDGVAEVVLFLGRSFQLAAHQSPGVLGELARVRQVADVSHLALADLDGDGRRDVVAVAYLDQVISFLHSDGSGRLAPARHVGFPARLDMVTAADLDGDGHQDLVGASWAGGTLLVRYGGAW